MDSTDSLAKESEKLAIKEGSDVFHHGQPSSSAICYRMEPAKRMLSHPGSACLSCSTRVGEGNHMPPCLLCDQQHSVVELEKIRRVALMVTPLPKGDTMDQAWEAVSTIRAILKQQVDPMTVTLQTVYIRSASDIEACRRLFEAYYGARVPPTNFVLQPPCGGQALAIEAWAVGGEHVDIAFPEEGVVSIAYDGLKWIHVAGITPPVESADCYTQTRQTFAEMDRRLSVAGATFNDVVRAWLYIGGITEIENGVERYRELNRARTDFFAEQEAAGRMKIARNGYAYYPASTGIGTKGRSLTFSGMALQSHREDVRLQPLENPSQTPAFDYEKRFSIKSPKFSRAMAVRIGDYVTTWISGTASIINSETVHLGDVQRQTEQTIDNIERLISAENFSQHGMKGAGARLSDLAKVRIYVKHPEDFDKCRAICERRFGSLPTIYAQADVCRSELLVEIEGVAFSRFGSS